MGNTEVPKQKYHLIEIVREFHEPVRANVNEGCLVCFLLDKLERFGDAAIGIRDYGKGAQVLRADQAKYDAAVALLIEVLGELEESDGCAE